MNSYQPLLEFDKDIFWYYPGVGQYWYYNTIQFALETPPSDPYFDTNGLYSTIKDYILFAEMLHSGKSKEGREIISKDTIDYMTTNLLNPSFFPIEIASVGTVKDQNYVNDLDPYGWGLGFRTLMDSTRNNNLGTKGEFGWAGAASTYFLVDSKKEISAVLMTQVLNGDPSLKNHFYKFIYTHF